MKMLNKLWLILILAFLVSCSGKSALERSRTPLKKIKPAASIKIGQAWHTKIGNGSGKKSNILDPLITGSAVYANAENGTIKAISIKNGKLFWQNKLNKTMSTGVGTGTNNIYIGSNSGQVLGFAKQNGKLVLKSKVLGGLIGAPAGKAGTVVARTLNGDIYGLNPAGNVIWQQKHEPPKLTIHSGASPVFYGNKAVMGLDDGNLMALDYANGNIEWLEPVAYSHGRNIIDRIVDVDATPVMEGDRMYVVSFHGNVSKIDAVSGTAIWSAKYSSVQPPAVSGNALVLTHEQGLITGFNKDNGAKVWEKAFLRGYDLTGPAAYGRYVAVGVKKSNVVFWLDSTNGKVVAKTKVAGDDIMSVKGSPYGIIIYTENGSLSLQRPG